MLPLNLADVTPEDIQDYIDSEVAESLTLDYKEAWPGAGTDDKREFVYDVAAFANEAGGDLIFGLTDRRGEDKQSTGIADKIAGVKIANAQTEIARLSNLIKDGIAPRLSGVVMQPVSCPDGDVLVVRVPHSWARPHMVTIGGVNKFVRRAPTGKYPMSVDEIRRAFSEQRELGETIDRWRRERAELTMQELGPAVLATNVNMLFHVIPASAFSRELLREPWRVGKQDEYKVYVPSGGGQFRYNADGYLASAPGRPAPNVSGYTQIFRSGITEYAGSNIFHPTGGYTRGPAILGQEIEKEVVYCYQDALQRLRRQGRTGGIYVGMTLLGIKEQSFFTYAAPHGSPEYPIRSDVFHSPIVFADLADDEKQPYRATLLPLVDTMWQVGGWSGTPHVLDGNWVPFYQSR